VEGAEAGLAKTTNYGWLLFLNLRLAPNALGSALHPGNSGFTYHVRCCVCAVMQLVCVCVCCMCRVLSVKQAGHGVGARAAIQAVWIGGRHFGRARIVYCSPNEAGYAVCMLEPC
jgi:hypothetical protein